MMMNGRRDVGETLIEILLTIVIISLTITALVSSLATVANAGTTQRSSVKVDVVLRNYAEANKVAAQSCVVGGNYTVTFSAPTGYTATVSPADTACPGVTAPKLLQLTVDGPSGAHATMQLRVRTP
jgi:type II secretory pathway pseudopilin PulG